MADTKNKCMDCKYAFKRSPFSYRQNGFYYASYECLKNQSGEQYGTEFKRCYDSCEHFERRETNEDC